MSVLFTFAMHFSLRRIQLVIAIEFDSERRGGPRSGFADSSDLQ